MAKGRKTTFDERIQIVSCCIANNMDYGKTIDQYGISLISKSTDESENTKKMG